MLPSLWSSVKPHRLCFIIESNRKVGGGPTFSSSKYRYVIIGSHHSFTGLLLMFSSLAEEQSGKMSGIGLEGGGGKYQTEEKA